jgi:MSHA pilin protein MshD
MSTSVSTRRQSGVTLVELVMFIVIISIALAGIIGVMNFTTSKSADPLRRKQALMIAEGLLEEVRLAAFTWCDPSSDTGDEDKTVAKAADCSRPEVFGNEGPPGAVFLRPFDNINDYVSAPNSAQAAFDINGVLSDAAGRTIGASGYSARLTLVRENLNGIVAVPAAPNNPADAEVLRIRVEVDYGGDLPVVLDTYRTRYAPQAR